MDKYLSMEIDKNSNMPIKIPQKATSKVDFRCYPEVKAKIKATADSKQTSITKIILEALFNYYERSSTIKLY